MELSEKIKNKDKTRPHLLHLLERGSERGGGGGGGGRLVLEKESVTSL